MMENRCRLIGVGAVLLFSCYQLCASEHNNIGRKLNRTDNVITTASSLSAPARLDKSTSNASIASIVHNTLQSLSKKNSRLCDKKNLSKKEEDLLRNKKNQIA